jgi:hypothetical protein
MKAEYGDALRRQLDHFPVWDVGSSVGVGDYGVVDDNCFLKHGNIVDEFQVTPTITTSSSAFWEFASEGTKVTETGLDIAIPNVGAQGIINLHFAQAYSLYILAAESTVSAIANLAEVTRQLHNHPGNWDHGRAIVTSARKTLSLVLLMNTSEDSSIQLKADPGTLMALKGARVSTSTRIGVTGDAGLKSLGASGAVYVDLARVRTFGGGPKPAAGEPFERIPARVRTVEPAGGRRIG